MGICIILTNLISLAIALHLTSSTDRVKIDLTQQAKTLSPKITYLCGIYIHGDSSQRFHIEKTIAEYDRIIQLIRFGGKVKDNDMKYSPPLESPFKEKAMEVADVWMAYKQDAYNIINNPSKIKTYTQPKEIDLNHLDMDSISLYQQKSITNPILLQSYTQLKDKSNHLLFLSDELSQMVLSQTHQTENRSQLLLYATASIICLAVLLLYFLIKRYILFPLDELMKNLKIISGGDYNHRIKKYGNNEVGQVVDAVSNVTEKIREVSSFVTEFSEGNMDVQMAHYDSNVALQKDSFVNAIVKSKNKLQKYISDNKLLQWKSEGKQRLQEMIKNNTEDMDELSKRLIRGITEYLDLPLGILYLINDTSLPIEEQKMVPKGAYAYNKLKLLDLSPDTYDGLISEVWQEHRTIHLKEVPVDYWQIKTGLGEAPPKAILIVPIKSDTTIGLLELGSFVPFTKEQIQFCEEIGESIGGNIIIYQSHLEAKRFQKELQQSRKCISSQNHEIGDLKDHIEFIQNKYENKINEQNSTITSLQKQLKESSHENE
ncbi:HAMP domain-containing protein [Sediminitomix flava]|uniref:HAMP domain-containing protein n=2 Tax=Sediminitomix flava TaxID=379075 RepID=A0A316A581_SEDFL|nr:HAMP domain-containing protein [Sediminitomix flava]